MPIPRIIVVTTVLSEGDAFRGDQMTQCRVVRCKAADTFSFFTLLQLIETYDGTKSVKIGHLNVRLRLWATSALQPSSSNESTATETFSFNGLRRETTLDEIESYFNRSGQAKDCEIEFDSNGRRLSNFTVTTSSPTTIAWLLNTSVHIVGASRCNMYKRKS